MDAVASVGMLAKDAERFRRGGGRGQGSSGAPEPRSQRRRARMRCCKGETSASAERRRAGARGAVAGRSERWSCRLRGVMFESLNVGLQTSLNVRLACRLWRAISHRVLNQDARVVFRRIAEEPDAANGDIVGAANIFLGINRCFAE